MPPNFQREGIDACKEIRKRHPGTGVVILSPVRRPRLRHLAAVGGRRRLRLPVEGPHRRGRPAGPGHPRGGDRRLDARPRDRRARSSARCGARASSTADDDELLAMVADGQADQGDRRRAARRRRPPSATTSSACSSTWPRACRAGDGRALRPAAPAARGDRRARGAGRDAEPPAARRRRRAAARRRAARIGETERLEVTVLMSDIRGYSTIAEHADPAVLAAAAQHATAPR